MFKLFKRFFAISNFSLEILSHLIFGRKKMKPPLQIFNVSSGYLPFIIWEILDSIHIYFRLYIFKKENINQPEITTKI